MIGSKEALVQLRDGLDVFLKRVDTDKAAVGCVEDFTRPDGTACQVLIRIGTSYLGERDWESLQKDRAPEDDSDTISA